MVKWAASFAMIAITYYTYTQLFSPRNIVIPEQAEMIVKNNPIGQKSKIYLPDGSEVWLNAESKLYYPAQFDSIREVELDGEAFFVVAENIDSPFIVTSGRIKTQALGTSFNIRAYGKENKIQVALVEGRVKVSVDANKNDTDYIINPGESIIYWKNEDDVEQALFSFDDVIGWKEGILAFNNCTREEVFEKLRRWYGVEFEFRNKPDDPSWNYNREFKNEYLDNILNSIGSIKKFDYKIDSNRVQITYQD